MTRIFIVGFGGVHPTDFAGYLAESSVRTIVDERLRPVCSMGSYTRAKTPDKGIERLLAQHGIGYESLIELGNPFVERRDWREPYRLLLERARDLLTEGLALVEGPFCLMCAEQSHAECHRVLIADFLTTRGYEVEHLGGPAEKPAGDPPEGLTYDPAFLNEREQERLLAWLRGLTYVYQRVRGVTLKRGLAQFGWTYDIASRSALPAEPFPPALAELAAVSER